MTKSEIIKKIKSELDNVPHGQKRTVMEKWVKRLGLSKYGIYRRIRSIYGNSKNVPSINKIPEKLILEIEKVKSDGAKNKKIISTENCIKILIERNFPEAEKLKASTVNKRLHKKGFKVILEEYSDEEKKIIKNYRSLPTVFKNELIKILNSFNKISKQK